MKNSKNNHILQIQGFSCHYRLTTGLPRQQGTRWLYEPTMAILGGDYKNQKF